MPSTSRALISSIPTFLVSRLGVVALLCLGACAETGSMRTTTSLSSDPALDALIAAEFQRHGIHPTSDVREFTETLPAELIQTASWGTKIGPCNEGGYAITSSAGHDVRLLRYAVDERMQGEALYAWVVVDAGAIACVFRSVREDSEMAPGVYSAGGGR